MRYDLAFIMYIITFAVSLYGFILFAWWWWRQGEATAVYMYVTLLFFGSVFSNAMCLYARHIFLISLGDYLKFVDTDMWDVRLVPTLAALGFIVVHMTVRVLSNRTNRGRRKGDR
jgi:hypothetical protein